MMSVLDQVNKNWVFLKWHKHMANDLVFVFKLQNLLLKVPISWFYQSCLFYFISKHLKNFLWTCYLLAKYLQYVRHYNQHFVYLLPTFWRLFLCFQGFLENSALMDGWYSRVGHDGAHRVSYFIPELETQQPSTIYCQHIISQLAHKKE